jgi:hypothetical protein
MHSRSAHSTLRRSSRVQATLPLLVTSLAGTYFSEECNTEVVNAHGCAVLSPRKLDTGVALRLTNKAGRETVARVVSCESMTPDNRTWRLAAQLERPENFWGLADYPADWAAPAGPISAKLQQLSAPVISGALVKAPGAGGVPSEAVLDLVAQRLEAPLMRMIADSLRPLRTQVTAIQENLARREANPSRFEVSLSQIPPELEQQLEHRLKGDLGPRVLEESRKQYAEIVDAAKTKIGQLTNQSYEEFQRRTAGELKIIEQKAQDISARISARANEQLDRGLGNFQQKLTDGENSLKQRSEQLTESLQQKLQAERHASRQDLEQLRNAAMEESERLRQEVSYLNGQIAKLDAAARSLESGLDTRLNQMAANTVKDTRNQLESMANEALQQLTAHGATMLSDQLDQASEKMTVAEKSAVAAVSESLSEQVTNTLRSFEQSIDQQAKRSVERWRLRLAAGLNSLAKSIGDQFHSEAEFSGDSD